jgi:hypothetical protein
VESRDQDPYYDSHLPGDLPEGTVHAILRQAGLSADDFLKL